MEKFGNMEAGDGWDSEFANDLSDARF